MKVTEQTFAKHPLFENLFPAHLPEEKRILEENILAEGIKEPLVVWNNFLVEGYARLEIAEKHGLKYMVDDTSLTEFTNENEVLKWKLLHQIGRRNLLKLSGVYYKGYLYNTLKISPASELKQFSDLSGKIYHQEGKKTAEILAEYFGESEKTIRNAEKFYLSINQIDTKTNNKHRDKLLNNQVRLSQGDINKLAKQEQEGIDFIISALENKKAHNYRTACFEWDKMLAKEESEKQPEIGELKEDNIYLGDSAELLCKMEDKSVSLILTDPPYGTDGNFEYADDIESAKIAWESTVGELARIMKDNGHAYFFFADRNEEEFKEILSKYFKVEYKLLWHKKGMKPSEDRDLGYTNFIEHFFFCTKKDCEAKPLAAKTPPNIFSVEVETKKGYTARKPVELMKQIIELSSFSNELVLDPFAGSGSTAQASILTGRKYIAMDISPKAVEIAQKNIEKTMQEKDAEKAKGNKDVSIVKPQISKKTEIHIKRA